MRQRVVTVELKGLGVNVETPISGNDWKKIPIQFRGRVEATLRRELAAVEKAFLTIPKERLLAKENLVGFKVAVRGVQRIFYSHLAEMTMTQDL